MKASPKIKTIKRNSDFQHIFEKGHSINGRYLVVYFLHNQKDFNRIGFCVGRKIGVAVTRNRLKRRLREVVREIDRKSNFQHGSEGYDIILVARKPIIIAQYQDIVKEYEYIMLKTGILTNAKHQELL